MSRNEYLLESLMNGEDISNFTPMSRNEEILKRMCLGESCDDIEPESRLEALLILASAKIGTGGGTGGTDRIQWKCDVLNSLNYEFYNYNEVTDLSDFFNGLDTSNVTTMNYTFSGCTNLTAIPALNTSNVKYTEHMFERCQQITTIPALDTSNVTRAVSMFESCSKLTAIPQFNTAKIISMERMFYGCSNLTAIPEMNTSAVQTLEYTFANCSKLTTIPALNTSNVTNIQWLFYNCKALTTITYINMIKASYASAMFMNCTNLTDLNLVNIKTNLTIGSKSSYGHLLTLESLLNTCQECIDTGSTKTLTVGTANLEKLAEVYVKLNEYEEELDQSLPKLPMYQCESTDSGAMLLTEYMTLKNWVLA